MTVSHGAQPVLGYENLLRGVTPFSDDAIPAYPVSQLADGRLSTQAGFASGDGEVIVDLGSSQSVDYVAIAKHTLGTEGATLAVDYSSTGTGGPWTSFLSQAPADDAPKLWQVSSQSSQYWRITISGHSANVYLADLALGAALQLPAAMPQDWLSPFYAPQGKMIANRTRRGDLVGLSLQGEPARCDIEMQLLAPSWFDSNWTALYASLIAWPFYFVHDADSRSDEVFFCWLRGNLPTAPYRAGGMYQSVRIEVEGITG